MRAKVAIETMTDACEFMAIASTVPVPVRLVGDGFIVSAKSLLGAMYTMEWAEVWCECEEDIYHKIEKFVI